MRSGSALRRNRYRIYIPGADDKSPSAAYVLAMGALVQIDDVTRRYDGSRRRVVDGVTVVPAAADKRAGIFMLSV